MSSPYGVERTDWGSRVLEAKFSHGRIKHDAENQKDFLIKDEEVALKHPESHSIVKLTDDGYIDIFAGDKVGIRIDPKTNSVNIFGDNLNFFGNQMNIQTKSNGFKWNGYELNPELYYENAIEKEQKVAGTKMRRVYSPERGWHWKEENWSVRPMVKSQSKVRYSEGMMEILKNLGLPVENVGKGDN